MDNKELGKRFRELRNATNIGQKQLADFLNVDQSQISKFEAGERGFSVFALERACSVFGISLQEFNEGKYDIDKGMTISFRANTLTEIDLDAIAAMNVIATNLKSMNEAIEGQD